MMLMALLRRLSDRALLAAGLLLVVAGELATGLAILLGQGPTLPGALTFTGGFFFGRRLIVAYPFVPWLAIMLLGWWFGRYLSRTEPARVERFLVVAGVVALAIFAALRGLNGYGNMRLLREDHTLVQWLHVSKYPPSITFITLELGLMALLLAGFFRLERTLGPEVIAAGREPLWLRPLGVLGQTALFYYLLHAHLLQAAAWALGRSHKGGLAETYVATVAALLVLYPACLAYRGYKRAHPDGWTRYV
jgi:uncharacterized membrane protein